MTSEQVERGFVLEELARLGVTTTQRGTSLTNCNYDELKFELVLASFREINIHADENKWF